MRSTIGQASHIVRGDARFFTIIVLIVALPSFIGDLLLDDRDLRSLNFVVSVVTLYCQLLATYRTLASIDLQASGYQRGDATEGRFLGAFVLQLLATIGIAIGLALLVVPGVALLGLWSLALAAFAAERRRPWDALGRSARLARPILGRLLLLGVAWLGIVMGGSIILAIPGAIWPRLSLLNLFLANLVPPTLLILGASLFAVAYGEARRIETGA